jgi:hypothetical protein
MGAAGGCCTFCAGGDMSTPMIAGTAAATAPAAAATAAQNVHLADLSAAIADLWEASTAACSRVWTRSASFAVSQASATRMLLVSYPKSCAARAFLRASSPPFLPHQISISSKVLRRTNFRNPSPPPIRTLRIASRSIRSSRAAFNASSSLQPAVGEVRQRTNPLATVSPVAVVGAQQACVSRPATAGSPMSPHPLGCRPRHPAALESHAEAQT